MSKNLFEKQLQSVSDPAFVLSQEWNNREGKFSLTESKIILDQNRDKKSELIEMETKPFDNIEDMEKLNLKDQESTNALSESRVTQHVETESAALQTMVKNDFGAWLLTMPVKGIKKNEDESSGNFMSEDKPSIIRKNQDSILDMDLSISSETLARLLTEQGHKAEAISMYEKLSLRFPEKKDTFALLIQKLKK